MVFLFDENIPYKIAEGFKILEEANKHSKTEIYHIKTLGLEGASDDVVIETSGKMMAIILTFDRDFKHIKSYYALYKKHKVGILLLKAKKQESNYWGIVKLLVNNWEQIKIEVNGISPPFIFEIHSRGVQRKEF